MKASKTIYVCTECDYQSAKWMGRCPSCGAWNTMEEQVISPQPASAAKSSPKLSLGSYDNTAVKFSELELPNYMREETGLGELDRVLGGGLVHGSVVLLSGEPGIGKSTLLMQISSALGEKRRVLYVSGEESKGQLKLRADRLGAGGDNLYLLTETNFERVISETDRVKPDIVIVDSIQTFYSDQISSSPGSVSQVKDCALRLITKAKNEGISVIIVGHVNKEGGIAGPKVLEHMVDAVLYFEGERQQIYRIIRAIKNRYGSTNEIGVFEMTDRGLSEVENPSEMLLAGRPKNVSGNCAVCVMEGSRPIIAEIQALATKSYLPSPKRTSSGLDYNRMYLLLAVLEKRLGLRFSDNDTFLNVIGGLRLDEPAVDLATALALISSIKDKPISDDIIAFGEVGLSGEVRAVSNIDQRIKEAVRLGFTQIVLPERNFTKLDRQFKEELLSEGILFTPVKALFDSLKIF
ncbi:MAG: DNA repair protein RadA [Clostridia bacterium]|nr:DNA repair protein RadA [Clostridia bacterium]